MNQGNEVSSEVSSEVLGISSSNVKFDKDLTEVWKSYFPVRNGVKPESFLRSSGSEDSEGRNYTNETLHYMSKARVARLITDKIEAYISRNMEGPESQYFIIDATAGIGGNTLDFLSRKNCVAVMSFERDPKRRLMLQRNIMGYKLGDKAIVPNGNNYEEVIPLTGEEDFVDYKGAIFFFDPPWLPEDFKGGKDYKKYYILKDAKVGNLTLEGWLMKFWDPKDKKTSTEEPGAYRVVFRMPPGYVLDSVPGWTYIIDELGNDGRLITCIPNFYIKGMEPKALSFDESETLIINTSEESKDVGSKRGLTSLMMKLKPNDSMLASQYANFRNSCNALSDKDFSKASNEEKCQIFVKWGFRDPVPVVESKPIPIVEFEDKKIIKIGKLGVESSGLGLQIKKDEYRTPMETPKPKEAVKNSKSRFVDVKIPIEQQVRVFTDYPKLSPSIKDKDSPEFVAEFQNYISWLLRQFIKKEDDVIRLLESEPMAKWLQAFTHVSYDPSRNRNYDLLEIIGDRATEYIFSKLLIDLMRKEEIELPDANKITQYKKEYMSETWQKLAGQNLGFKDWIRIREPFNNKLFEDILESFIGALSECGDIIRGNGYGINLCSKFIDMITRNIKFDRSLTFGDPKTQVNQRFERAFGGNFQKNAIEDINPIGSAPNIIVNVKLTLLAKSALEAEKFTIPENRIISIGKGTNLTDATKNAYEEANKFLDKIGFTNEKSIEMKEIRNWTDIERVNPVIYNQAKSKLKREGYDDNSYFFKIVEKTGVYYVYLNGFSSDNKSDEKSLGFGKNSDRIQAKINAINDYLRS